MNNLKTELLAQLEQELPSLIALKGYGQKKILEFLDVAIDKSYKVGQDNTWEYADKQRKSERETWIKKGYNQGIADSVKDLETHYSKGIPIKEIIKALKENSNQ